MHPVVLLGRNNVTSRFGDRFRQGEVFLERALQDFLRDELFLVLSNHHRTHRSGKRVLDDDTIGLFAEDDANGWILVLFLNVSVEGLKVELQLSKVLSAELPSLQLEGDESLQPAMIEEKVGMEILPADRQGVLLIDEEEILTHLKDEVLDVRDDLAPQLCLTVFLRQREIIKKRGILEHDRRGRIFRF